MDVKIKDNQGYVDAEWTIEDGVMVVSPKEVKVDVSKFNTGDILVCGWENEFQKCSWVCVLDGRIEECKEHYFLEEYCGTYLVGGNDKEPIWHGSYSDSATWIRLATEAEKKLLFDRLAEEGYEFDFDKNELVKIKWKPSVGQHFYYVEYDNESFAFITNAYTYAFEDQIERDKAIAKGWCFRTAQECKEFCNRLNDAINQVKP